jgi:8-oxo-dGTP pyrophosphatase MutT (NUDIX family)
MHADVRRTLEGWSHPDPEQMRLRAAYLAHLDAHADGVWRSCAAGHITASTLVMDESRERVLLTLHPKVGRWLQLGGHIEPDDASLRAAAQREAIEESGIEAVTISVAPLRLDRHPVPCGGAMNEHLDVQFLSLVPDGSLAVMSAESDDLRWFEVEQLPDVDASVRALVDDARRR